MKVSIKKEGIMRFTKLFSINLFILWLVCILVFFSTLIVNNYINKSQTTYSPVISYLLSISFYVGIFSFLFAICSMFINLILRTKLIEKTYHSSVFSKIQFTGILFLIIVIIFLTQLVFNPLHLARDKGSNVKSFIVNGLPIHSYAPTPDVENIQHEALNLTNSERIKAGLSSLKENNQLDQAALNKAKDLVSKNYFTHFSPSGKSPWDFINESGYQYVYAAENLGRGFFDANSLVSAWMNSPEHKANILSSKYTEIGIAAISGDLQGENTIIVVQEFASPQTKGSGYIYNNQGLDINQVKQHKDNITTVQASWINVKNKYPSDTMNSLLDSFTRQLLFCDQIINDYSKNGSFSPDDLALWQAVIKMSNETYQITNKLN